ncbi:hypothetical protein B0H13DRAFT_1887155 [Mycena leptocephala]|nr:hypothetical protein B0H13DRAFT_1887155 [Mycena leptocephala]
MLVRSQSSLVLFSPLPFSILSPPTSNPARKSTRHPAWPLPISVEQASIWETDQFCKMATRLVPLFDWVLAVTVNPPYPFKLSASFNPSLVIHPSQAQTVPQNLFHSGCRLSQAPKLLQIYPQASHATPSVRVPGPLAAPPALRLTNPAPTTVISQRRIREGAVRRRRRSAEVIAARCAGASSRGAAVRRTPGIARQQVGGGGQAEFGDHHRLHGAR